MTELLGSKENEKEIKIGPETLDEFTAEIDSLKSQILENSENTDDDEDQNEAKEQLTLPEKIAEAMYEDFKNKIFEKKDKEGRQYYSAQLLGTVDFLGSTFLERTLQERRKNPFSAEDTGYLGGAGLSLQLSGISSEEISDFFETFKRYLNAVPQMRTEEDVERFTKNNTPLSFIRETSINFQLKEEIKKRVDIEKNANAEKTPDWFKNSEKIGTIPKPLPLRSAPFERSNTGCTLCSKTARKNAQNFGINVPRGNANVAQKLDPIDDTFKISLEKEELQNYDLSSLASGTNFADIYTTSKSRYGHRAAAFLNQSDNQRYVLDPYTKPSSRDPIPFSEYQERRTIVKANFYQSEYLVS